MTEPTSARPRAVPCFDGSVPPPDFVNVETTRFCNLECRMCIQFNDGTTVTGPHMDLADFTRIAESVFPYVQRWQPSVAGEPTMSRDFDKMVALAERFGVKAEIVTNGTLLDDRTIDKLVPNVASVTFSFDGATKDTFEFIRRGAKFDDVTAKIRKLVGRCRQQLPAALQPHFAINCTLMEKNVRELPQLVRFAAEDLGVDFVSCYHVFPVTEEMKSQSLVHHRELARRCIDEAFEVARQVGIALEVHALDQLTAATAKMAGSDREWATSDGVVDGLEHRSVPGRSTRSYPRLEQRPDELARVGPARDQAYARSGFPAHATDSAQGTAPGASSDSIWWCNFLWNRTYVHIGGNVRPCCVHQAPVVGNLLEQPFEQIWNNEHYRALRQLLVAKDPAPVCKGCMHIQEVHDPAAIARHLRGTRVPRDGEKLPVTPPIDPKQLRRQRSGTPPELVWDAVPGARAYVVEFSLDRFATVLYSTESVRGGPAIRESRYRIPGWAWKDAPVDDEIFWRVRARSANGDEVVASGSLPPEKPA